MTRASIYHGYVMTTTGIALESRFIDIDGIRTHYLTAGDGEPVLLLPGLAASAAMSTEITIKPLAERFKVYALDLPGSGESEKPEIDYTLESAIRHVADFLDANNLDNISVIGLSRGGMIGLGLTLGHPKRVRRLVLVDSAGLGPEVNIAFRMLSLPVLGELFGAPPRFMGKAILKRTYQDSDNVNVDYLANEFYRLMHLPGAKSAFLKSIRHGVGMNGLKPHVVMRDRLREISAPTLIVWGSSDHVIPVDHAYATHKLISGSQLHIFSRCGHDPAQERIKDFVRLVAGFLDGGHSTADAV